MTDVNEEPRETDEPVPAPEASSPEANEYVFVELPNGDIRAVHKSEIRKSLAGFGQEQTPVPLDEDPEVYAHLANGDVVRLKTSELPGSAGTNAQHGFLEKDGNVHYVIGVYPVEHQKG